MNATIISGDTTLTGEAIVKKNCIEVKTREFGKLVFDRQTGKAKHGQSFIQNIAEVLESVAIQAEEKLVWIVHEHPNFRKESTSLICVLVTKESPRKISGILREVESVVGVSSFSVGQPYERDLPASRYDRQSELDRHFISRGTAVQYLADRVVGSAWNRLDNVRDWKPFEHDYLGFLSALNIELAVNRFFEGRIEQKNKYRSMGLGEEPIDEAIKPCHLIDFINHGKVPSIVMINPPKENKKK